MNWFLKDEEGKYLWPGFGENSRILKWIFERTSNQAPAQKTPIGLLPETLDLTGLHVELERLLEVSSTAWLRETEELSSYFKRFGERMPKPLLDELDQLKERLCSPAPT